MSPRFDPATYPGRRPSGPTLVWQGREWAVDLGPSAAVPATVEIAASGARILGATDRRWIVAYGSNANPDRIIDKGLDERGTLLFPARMSGWAIAWEARRSPATGAVPVTLVERREHVGDVWVVAVHPDDLHVVDATEGRGHNYHLGRVGPVAVASRWLLADALAYGPGPDTHVLGAGADVLTYPDHLQDVAATHLDETPVPLRVDPLPGSVESGWPETPLEPLPLFVYGTLQPGAPRWGLVADHVAETRPASTRGRLTATFYGYPALETAGGRDIHGVLLAPHDDQAAAELYRITDEVEDAPHLFVRTAVRVVVDGAPRWAATYLWNGDRQGPPPGTEVADGRWTP